MVIIPKNTNKVQLTKIGVLKNYVLSYWQYYLIGFVFCITRIRYLTYPLGLIHRQYLKELWRSYSAIVSTIKFTSNPFEEQPVYIFLLKILYIISGRSPTEFIFLARCFGFILSFFSLLLIYKIGNMAIGNYTAKFAAFLYAISPYGIFIGIGVQRETLMWFFGLFSIFLFMKYMEKKDSKYILASCLLSLFSLMTKFTGIYFVFCCVVFIILFYSVPFIEIKIPYYSRIFILIFFFLIMSVFSIQFALSYHKTGALGEWGITARPDVFFDSKFWYELSTNAMLFIPSTTLFLGVIGFFYNMSLLTKKSLIIIIWTIFAGLEVLFYGYGSVIHEYYIIYLLHPVVILAGSTLSLLCQIDVQKIIKVDFISIEFSRTLLFLFIFICSGFVPFFNYIGEINMVEANRPFHEDIRSIGLYLKDLDIDGNEIGIIVIRENYLYWKQHIILASTYIAKPGVSEYYISDKSSINIRAISNQYKVIIGWSDDLDHVRNDLLLYYGDLKIYPQNTFFRDKYELTSIELWLKSDQIKK